MNVFIIAAVCVAFLARDAQASVDRPCVISTPDLRWHVDLRDLGRRDWDVERNLMDSIFLNPCQPLFTRDPVSTCPNGTYGCEYYGAEPTTKLASLYKGDSLQLETETAVIVLSGGDECSFGTLRTLAITFICDPDGDEGAPRFVNEAPLCVYNLEWHTKLACPVNAPPPDDDEVTIPCIIASDDQKWHVDARDLGRRDWIAYSATGYQHIRFNPCQPLVESTPDSICTDGSYGCQFEGETSVAMVASNYWKDSLNLATNASFIHLGGGQPCTDGSVRNLVISLICKPDNPYGVPIIISEYPRCTYNIQWETFFACPIYAPPPEEEEEHIACLISSQEWHTDLRPLGNSDWTVRLNDSRSIRFNPCQPMVQLTPDAICPNGTYGCQYDGATASAKLASLYTLDFLDIATNTSVVSLGGGDTCVDGSVRNIVITFVCDNTQDPGVPMFVNENPLCTYNVKWATKYACPINAPAPGRRGRNERIRP